MMCDLQERGIMAAICACLNRNHRPCVDVGNPDLPEGDVISMQVIEIPALGVITDETEVVCMDVKGTMKLVKVSWLLAFSCEMCERPPTLDEYMQPVSRIRPPLGGCS